ncbi:quinone oxidoreductase [Rhizobium sp. LCM 4573]|uniref:quinone oxidoreductase family protein n=1 Tax=Rhizobium sp. LCM 4573 TaxID=1848291 RepID=UPI0008DB2BE7|nr:quinone oxidoreductase [Rhizobium sp. LCM 4573]OHV84431.1 alcohol dehydrogenase [Rhizobium sp. LCM 4573]
MTDIAVSLLSPGGVDRFQVSEQPALQPGADEILMRHEAIGMNFLDIYHRNGTYTLPSYPAVLGVEAAGVVETVGPGVESVKPGDRVVYGGTPGAYASIRLLPAARAIPLSADLSPKIAAASLLKTMTAYMLLHKTYPVEAGTVILVHAAAGGLGTILTRWAKHLGATVIGTVSTQEKADFARSNGADHVIVGRDADIVSEVRALTDGKGVHVAYDGIGGDMLVKTIHSVRPLGMAASIGQAAGPIPPLSVDELRPGKSLSRPSIMAYVADTANYREAAEAAIAAMRKGIIATVAGEYPLEEAAKAQAALESGKVTGSLLLIPG